MRPLLRALVCVGFLTGCGDGVVTAVPSQSEVKPAPRILTPANDGAVYSMKVGQSVGLLVPDPNAPDPEVQGRSVEVTAVVNVDASGRREWELRAVASGRTTLRAAGSRPYTITLDVSP
jgi:predicted secreted protein